MPDFDSEKLLNRKLYGIDFRALLCDIEDFLEFSEHNLDWQRRRELQSIDRQDLSGYPPEYRDHLVENAEHRFTASLPIRLRYAALIALTTTVEWEAKALAKKVTFCIGKTPKQMNETVHRLRRIDEVFALGARQAVDEYAHLVIVRNAIVHAAGVERDYKHRDELKRSASRLMGFSIASWHAWLGACVTIERNALLPYIRAMSELLPRAWEQADAKGMLKRTHGVKKNA